MDRWMDAGLTDGQKNNVPLVTLTMRDSDEANLVEFPPVV